MTLFHWPRSTALERYGCGDIIVEADTVDQARAAVRAHAEVFLRQEREWLFNLDGSIDDFFRDDLESWFAKLEHDLAQDPVVVTTPIFIQGSE